jgi:hypothetical protein
MALIIEDGSVVDGAQSYAAASDLVTYASLRDEDLTAVEAEQEALLVKAMDALQGRCWKGDRVSYDQDLAWPRYGVYRDNQLLPSDEIPDELTDGQMALAMAAIDSDLTPTFDANAKGPITEETVHGAVTRKYATPTRVSLVAAVTSAEKALRALMCNPWNRVIRA